ncbi:MAG TPA: hypothetical protein VF331_05795 [Polyangiales bacterium]
MIGAAKRYSELLTKLLVDRELAGGSLPEEIESHYVEELDRCWWAMTSAEQDEFERTARVEHAVTAPTSLDEEDVTLLDGARTMPRRAA